MPIAHSKVSAKSDGGDSSLVLPSDWNDYHVGGSPNVDNYAGQYTSSGTSTVVTVTAPTPGVSYVAVVYSTGRGCDSITQTNVAWTKRYTGNGNSQYLEVWTGVVSASPGTTATFAFTGTNHQVCEVFELPDAPAFTAASALATSTAATTARASVGASSAAVGDWLIWGVSSNNAAGSISNVDQSHTYLSVVGGQGRGGVLVAQSNSLSFWSTSDSAVSHFSAIVKLS